jgi:hypothetical protein
MSVALGSEPSESAKDVVSMSRTIALITVALAAWLGGGFVAFEAPLRNGAALASESGGHGKPEGGHGKDDKKGDDESAALSIENLTIPVIRHQRVERHVTLSFTLEPSSADARRKIYDAIPRLRNAYMMDLMGYLRIVNLEGETPQVDAIRVRLMQVTERTIGAGMVKSLYFQRTGERVL